MMSNSSFIYYRNLSSFWFWNI